MEFGLENIRLTANFYRTSYFQRNEINKNNSDISLYSLTHLKNIECFFVVRTTSIFNLTVLHSNKFE